MAKFRKRAKGRYLDKIISNEDIKFHQIKVILPDDGGAREVSKSEGLKLAESYGLDLVLISETSTPPICKIIDHGKFLYEQKKKENEKNKNQTKTEIKGIRLSLNIGEHDFQMKVKQAIGFLEDRNNVKVKIRFRGREQAYGDMGIDRMNEFAEALKEYGKIDQVPTIHGKKGSMSIIPLKKK